jgi:hypothetical protein
VKAKSILDKELQKDSKAAGNLKQAWCKFKSRTQLSLGMVTF